MAGYTHLVQYAVSLVQFAPITDLGSSLDGGEFVYPRTLHEPRGVNVLSAVLLGGEHIYFIS